MDIQNFIDCINKNCRKSVNSMFNLSLFNNNYNLRNYTIDGTSYAVNKDGSVKVLYWFDNFWLFLGIKFIKTSKRKETQITISLSVFQGEDSDSRKCQLFRAEWDDYDNPNEPHPQPHWHITSNQVHENTFNDHADDFNESEFLEKFNNGERRAFDVENIHFAMNGDWDNSGNHVHKIENEKQIVNWLQGMLDHIRTELESL